MPSQTPPKSVAQRLTAAAFGELSRLRDDLDNPRPIPPGAFEGEAWKALKLLASLASLPVDVAFERWRDAIRSAADRCETQEHLARLTWPPVAFADRRMRWIAGELGRRAVDARLEAEQAKRARELPPGAVGARVFGPPRASRAKPGEAPTCDPKRAAELQAQFDAAFGGDA